jgi:hypothetical protein
MNPIALLTAAVAVALTAASASAAPDAPRRDAWEVQFDNGGVVDLRLLCEGGKVAAGFALETDRNVPWFADASGLMVAGGRLRGKVTLTPGPDLVAAVAAARGRKPAKPPAPEELTLDLTLKDGRVTGTITGPKVAGGLLGHGVESVKVRGRVRPDAPAEDAQIEFMPLGVASTGAEGLYAVGEAAYLRLQLRGGKVRAAKLIPVYHQKADPSDLAVPGDRVLVTGTAVKGRVPFKFTTPGPKPREFDGTLTLDGVIIGDLVAGKARWEGKGQGAADTTFRGRVSRAKELTPLDTSARTWQPQGKPLDPDPALAAKAKEEGLTPIFPGEPGKQEFYSTRPIHLKKFNALFPPTTAFAEVPKAARHRITISPAKNGGPAGGPWSFEADEPWAPLTGVWKDVPPGQLVVTAVGLDKDGKEVGAAVLPETAYRYVGGDPLDEQGFVHWTHPNRAKQVLKDGRKFPALAAVPVTKKAPFAGPYWAPTRTPEASALALARYVRDDLYRAQYRGAWSLAGFTGGDGGDVVGLATLARACATVARLTDDPVERDEAVALAERTAWRAFLSHRDKLPTVYKHNASLMVWIGFAYLDVYAASKDARFKGAALNLAGALAADQHPDGGWPGVKSPWPGGVFGPSEFRTNGAEAVLWYLGRVRAELGVKDFAPVEEKAAKWVRKYCLPAMTWQNVGYHSGEMVPVQDTVAPHALAYCTWLLDSADPDVKDVKLVADVARWCEERHVDWARTTDPVLTRPSCWGWSRAAGTGVRVAGSLAYVCARLWQETGDPLWKAKAEALVQGILVSQDPVTGGYAYHFRRTTEDTPNHHTYDTVEAARCVQAATNVLARGRPEKR